MENRFKLKISRMFRSSFVSCRTRKISDDIEKPVFSPQNNDSFHFVEPFSSPPHKAQPIHAAINAPVQAHPRRKSSERHPRFRVSASDIEGRRKYPPPAKPLNIFSDCKDFGFYEKKKKSSPRYKNKKKKKNTKRVHVKSRYLSSQETVSYNNNNPYYGTESWFSSEDDETETFFSSRTRSSDSSESLKKQHSDCRKMRKTRRRRRAKNGVLLPLEGTDRKVKDSFAVVKSSSDPYNDFRTSMVEMIVERQIFAAKDLEELLQCFLSLNSHRHHNIIVEVFTEIWEALISF